MKLLYYILYCNSISWETKKTMYFTMWQKVEKNIIPLPYWSLIRIVKRDSLVMKSVIF